MCVSAFPLDGWQVVVGRVPPTVVIPGDPGEDRRPRLGAGVEPTAVDQLDFERGEEALGDGVIQARPGATHRPPRPQPLTRGGVPAEALVPRTLMQLVFLAATLTVLAHHVRKRRPALSATDHTDRTSDVPVRPQAAATRH